MDYSSELLFFFSALGAFNGIILGLYFLLYARPKHISNYFLGALLLALSIRVGKSVFYYFNPDLAVDYLQLGLTACFFIGPSLYFYIKSVVQPDSKHLHHWKYHYVFMAMLALGVGFVYSFEENIDLWNCIVIPSIYYQWFAYIIATAYLLKDIFINFIRHQDKRNSVEVWLLSIFLGNLLIWTAYKFYYMTSYISGALSFSFILYIVGLLLVFNKKKDFILFKKQPKYATKKIGNAEAKQLLEQLQSLMTKEELHKNPNIKLPDVAKKLNILPHRLSQLINDNLEKSFTLFINEYRIQEAQKMLVTNDQFSLEAIGYECGFNSKSTFYSAFKKMTGTTPAKYKNALINEN